MIRLYFLPENDEVHGATRCKQLARYNWFDINSSPDTTGSIYKQLDTTGSTCIQPPPPSNLLGCMIVDD
jgi:hypothetical protein